MLKSLFCEDISVEYEFKSVKFKGGIDGIDRRIDRRIFSVVRKQKLIFNANGQASPTNLD